MSRLVQVRRGGKSATPVSGTLSGSGTLAIMQGAGQVSLTGRGGNGDSNYWYDPGQPYIAPTYINTWSCDYTAETYYNGNLQSTGGYSFSGTGATPPNTLGSTPGEEPGWITYYSYTYHSTGSEMTDPGQPYIAPSSGGGPLYGTNTTATLNGVTRTWIGGYDSGVVGATSTQTIESNEAGQNLTYSVASTGALSYYYEY